jgi:hypothetical protein
MRFILTKESATLELYEGDNKDEDAWQYDLDEQSWYCLGELVAKTVWVSVDDLLSNVDFSDCEE